MQVLQKNAEECRKICKRKPLRGKGFRVICLYAYLIYKYKNRDKRFYLFILAQRRKKEKDIQKNLQICKIGV